MVPCVGFIRMNFDIEAMRKETQLPKTLNSLMQHLRASGISISGSTQKRKLKNLGYYHGYKGYRFVGRAENRLPLSDFSQIVAINDFDMQLKSLLFPRMMLVETALKNYTLEAVLADAKSESFEVIWVKSLTGYRGYASSSRAYSMAWGNRQRLRQEIDGLIYRNHNKRDVIRHFRDVDAGIPVWALFEIMTLGNFGAFYDCLDMRVKASIVHDVGLPTNLDSTALLKHIIYALKDLRNAIAHNGVVLDVRFKTGRINTGLTTLMRQEMGIGKVDFSDITDYVLLLVFLMRKMRFTKTECRQLINGYQAILERFRSELPIEIYSKVIKTTARSKLEVARRFLSSGV